VLAAEEHVFIQQPSMKRHPATVSP